MERMTPEQLKEFFKNSNLRTLKIPRDGSNGAEEIELTEEDDRILDKIWDERGRRDREEKMKEQKKE